MSLYMKPESPRLRLEDCLEENIEVMAVFRENQRDRRETSKLLSQKQGGDDFKEKGVINSVYNV